MKTLCIYTGYDGEPRQCLIQHEVDIRKFDLTSGLPEMCPDHRSAVIIRDQPDDFAPQLETELGDDITCHYIMLADRPTINA